MACFTHHANPMIPMNTYRLLLAAVLLMRGPLPLPAWQVGPAQPGKPARTVHPTHTGRVTFAATDIPPGKHQPADFLTAYALTPRSQLYMTVFLGKPLLEHLRELAPERTAAALDSLGSYQFTFYVDDQRVNVVNMPPGNVETATKRTETIVRKPLIARPRQRTWGESIWNIFLMSGGQQALTEGKHTFKLEIRPFLQLPQRITGKVIAEGRLEMDVRLDPAIDPATVQLQTPQPYAGLAVSHEKFDVNRIRALKGNTDAYVFKDIASVVVLKNGKLLIEEYFNGADRNTLHDVRSVGKSFASTAAGIAIGEGFLKSENQSLKEFYNLKQFANRSPQKDNCTLKDLLTMRAAFEGNDDERESAGNEEKMYPTADWVKFTLDLPVDSPRPAGEWHYFTAGVVLLGDILHRRVPGGLEQYTDRKLFAPLGITQYKWQYTPQKVVNTAGGIRMNALDFAKYGQLYQNGGKWNGKQLIPKAWVDKTFTRHEAVPGRKNEYYGYLFWNRTYQVNGRAYETYYCSGNGGNKIFIFKDQPLVVVVTARAFNTPYAHAQVDKMMEEYILPATLGKE